LLSTDATTNGSAQGGAFLARTVHLERAVVRENQVAASDLARAGALGADRVDVRASTIADNVVTSTNGEAYGGGAVIGGGTLDDTTVFGNQASGPQAHGGGLVHRAINPVEPGDLAVVNSTITGNAAIGSPSSYGGGIEQPDDMGAARLEFTTVAGNTAAHGANLASAVPAEASASATTDVLLFATVVAEPLGGANCDGVTLASSTYADVTDASCGIAAGPDPQLGSLDDNGGPTLTMLPSATSPLLDRVATIACLALVTTDQRGITRPQGTACDIGAVEREVAPAPPPPTPPLPPTDPSVAPTGAAATPVVAQPTFTG
jgi:hypothetical protein